MDVTIFASIFDIVQNGILATVQGKTTAIIALASPIMAICFTIYLMMIASNAMRGNVGTENIMDLFQRSIAWALIITMAFNIQYYNYVVDFFNGLGADLSGALGKGGESAKNSGAMLDGLLGRYVDQATKIYTDAEGFDVIAAVAAIVIMLCSGAVLLAIAAGYVLLAQIGLGILLAIGPIFIALALFPATRKFFDAWIGQCVNYVLLTVLFNFVSVILGDMINAMFAKDLSIWVIGPATLALAVAFILVALNIPSLASALSGGVGISSMVGKPLQAASAMHKGVSAASGAAGRAWNFMRGKGGSVNKN